MATNERRERTAVRPRRRWWRRCVWAFVAIVLVPAAMHTHVLVAAASHTGTVAEAPPADGILVLGARIHADGAPFDLLADRLAAALASFEAGKAPCIVASGRGDAALDRDEVGAMRRWLVARGVGLDAHGVEAPYRRACSTGTMLRNRGREVAARVRAWLDVFVLGAGR